MRRKEIRFYIIVFIISFLFSAIITIKDGYLYQILFKISMETPGMESYTVNEFNELKKHMIKGVFKPQLVFEIIKDLLVLPIILITVIVAMMQINLKNRKYVYLVGRDKRFFRKYISDSLRKMTVSTFAIHISFSLWILICFIINGQLDPDGIIAYDSGVQNIKFIQGIHRQSPAVFMLIMAWIPVYVFTNSVCLLTIILNEIYRSKPVTIGIIIGYLYLTSQLLAGLGYFHLGPITPIGVSTLVEYPYQYIFVPLLFTVLLLIITLIYRRIMKVDEL